MDTINATGLRSVVVALEHNPHRWDQNTFYSTGTGAMCLASWTCALAGLNVRDLLTRPGGGYRIVRHAQALLGLTDDVAQALFDFGVGWDEHPSVDQIKHHITEHTGVTFP